MDNINNNNEVLKNDAQLAGRIPTQYKKFIDSLYRDDEGNIRQGESFPAAIKKLIDAYKAKPLEQGEFNFNEDLNNIKNAASLITNAIFGLQAKTELYVKSQMEAANNKIEEKNNILKDAELSYNEAIYEVKEENNMLELKVEDLSNDLLRANEQLDLAESELNNLKDEIIEKNSAITSLNADKNKLSADAANSIQEIVTLKNKINDLHSVESENLELKHKLEELLEANRDNEAKISNLTLNLKEISSLKESREEDNRELSKEVTELKNSLNTKEIEHQKELITLERDLEKKFKVEIDAEIEKIKSKYEAEIKELTKKNYKLEAQLESINK